MYDVIVIGAGVIGCSVARYLSRYELAVAVLEKEADVADGTSKANTGIVHSGHDTETGTKKAYYNLRGNEMYEKLCSELCVPYKNNGTLVVALSPEQNAQLDALVEKGRRNGVKGVRRLSRDELIKMEPSISKNATGAFYAPTGGIVCPYALTEALADNAADNGAEFFLNTQVLDIRQKDGGFALTTENGEFSARCIVNCAGLFADEINNMVCEKKYHITARKGEYLILDKRHASAFNAAIFQLPVKLASGHTKGIVIAPTVDGTIMLGPTAEDCGKTELQNTAHGFDMVLEGASLSWDSIPRGDFISGFAGLRAHEDGNDFVIGATAVEGFYNCLGIESPGLTAAPAIGEEVSDMVAAYLNAKRKTDFNPCRVKPKPFRDMTPAERAEAIKNNPDYGTVVCRCETVTEAEVRDAIRGRVGARTLDAIKRRTRAGMGRCQSGFCSTRVMEILCEELSVSPLEITKNGRGGELLSGKVFEEE